MLRVMMMMLGDVIIGIDNARVPIKPNMIMSSVCITAASSRIDSDAKC